MNDSIAQDEEWTKYDMSAANDFENAVWAVRLLVGGGESLQSACCWSVSRYFTVWCESFLLLRSSAIFGRDTSVCGWTPPR